MDKARRTPDPAQSVSLMTPAGSPQVARLLVETAVAGLNLRSESRPPTATPFGRCCRATYSPALHFLLPAPGSGGQSYCHLILARDSAPPSQQLVLIG